MIRHAQFSLALSLAFPLAACATVTDPDPIEVAPQGECDAVPVQSLVGERATAQLGGRIVRDTSARNLRWIPPRSAVTQDFRPDRVNVAYDDDYIIQRIYCG